MDDRYFFFALTDPYFFDVPGAGDHPAIPVPERSTSSFRRAEAGPWVAFHPTSHGELPESGWKIHVSATPADAPRAVAEVARIAAVEQVAWKMLRSQHLVRVTQHKYAPLSLSGKVCVLYPRTDRQTADLVGRLAVALREVSGARLCGDHPHSRAPLGVRWGAYREHWTQGLDGRMVLAARGPHGPVVDDRRCPAPEVPEIIAAALGGGGLSRSLPLREVRLVHRCNAGALYDARLTDGRRVALKEARHHTGFDGEGIDAVTRLRHEYAVLQRLSGSAAAPEPLDYWEAENSDLMVMEWVEGDTLARHISRDHPLGRPGVDPARCGQFFAWADQVASDLRAQIGRLRARGVTHGDLHPGNVIVQGDRPVLIDFEAATLDGRGVTRTIGMPGFHLEHEDPVARDEYAMNRTVLALKESEVPPVDSASALSLAGDQDRTRALRDRLADDLLSRATPERADRLFCGGIEQFTTPLGGHDLLSGAAGVLLALQAAGRVPDPRHLDWLARVPQVRCRAVHGLAEGVEGIALALALLGRAEQAEALLDELPEEAPDSWSWARGKAGCAVALLELGSLLGRVDLTERGKAAADAVRLAVDDDLLQIDRPGLLDGWAGIALSLLKIGELLPTRSATFRAAAERAMRRERAQLRLVEGHLVATPEGRARLGLGHGSGAFALALTCLGGGTWAADRSAAGAAMRTLRWPVAGLMDGLVGMAVTLRACGDDEAAVRLEERAAGYCAPTPRGWSTLGSARIRHCDDVMTGSAGLIAGTGSGGVARVAHVLRLPEALAGPVDDTCHSASLALATAAQEHTDV